MQINNLGGARLPVTTTADSASQTARTRFGTLVSASAGAPAAGAVGLPGSSIVAKAISVNSSGIPGSGFGAPYLQAIPSNTPAPGTSLARGLQGQTPATGSGPNGELQAALDKQKEGEKAMRDLMKMSLMSIVSSTFAAGQNRPKIEALED